MIHRMLLEQLDKVAGRYRSLRIWQTLSLVWLLAAAAGGVWAWKFRGDVPASLAIGLLSGVAVLFAALAAALAARSARSPVWVARQVETAFPELKSCLLAAVEQRPEWPQTTLGYLQTSVIQQALDHARSHDWRQLVSRRRLTLAMCANVFTFSLFALALLGMTAKVAPAAASAAKKPRRTAAPGTPVVMTVEPGDTEVERGTSLMVLARIEGDLPAQATLVSQAAGGEAVRQEMPASLNDPIFGARISGIEQPLEYRVELEGQTSPTYHITVFEYPRLERSDARLVFPTYTGMESRLIEDVRTVSVVEGTEVTWLCRLNKPVASARLMELKAKDATPIELTASAEDPQVYTVTIPCQRTLRLELHLVDDAGRKNTKPDQFSINVLPNRPPTLKPLFPARDLEVSALEEVDLKAEATDDFGMQRLGLTYTLAGQPPVEVVVAENVAARQKQPAAQMLRLEDLHAEPDQLLSYYWWAEDFAATGELRRTESDMYFAEVRPFDEIFRQGAQPPGGQQQKKQPGESQNAQDAQQLAKLQKDIINATWKLIRRETRDKPTDAFAPDVEQVRSSQAAALQQATALAERVQDEQAKVHVEAVLKQMQAAVEQLKAAQEGPVAAPLQPALAAEQQAYQSLLKLRAREHEVVRQQQQQSGQQSASEQSRSDQQRQQMEQLDLKEEENRYETQRSAQETQQESAAERENRQVLNRLRELARRQHDLNERVKELQSSLEEAQTLAQKEEIRRQLQRLQDEQRQILQDTDELQSRLEQPENQERMSEERQQLQETRDQVRRASEALEKQKVSQAAAAGSRAEKQFEELREEFRRRASARFNEEMRELRDSAQRLDEKEREIGKQLRGDDPSANEPSAEPRTAGDRAKPGEREAASSDVAGEEKRPRPAPTLREDDNQNKIAEELQQQRKDLSELQEKMRDTIERAESTEPILSQRLYETVRNLRDQNIEKALEFAEQSQRRGLKDDARKLEAIAGQGIQKLRQEVEKAAEGVMGDGTEALRRARGQLQNLRQELNEELERNAPGLSGESRESQEAESEPQEGTPRSQAGTSEDRGEKYGMGDDDQTPGDQPGGKAAEDGEAKSDPEQQGKQPGSGKANGKPAGKEPGEQPGAGQGKASQESQQPGSEGKPESQGKPSGEGQPQDQQGKPGLPDQRGQPQPGRGEQTQKGQPGERGSRAQRGQPGLRDANPTAGTGTGGPIEGFAPRQAAPLTGQDFRQWSDRLRDVEEMVDDPELRAEATRIRERARALRAESQRHSALPNWELVRDQLSKPLAELERRVAEELLRRTSKKALVPLDRDPVPPQFSEKTRRYYERLGSGK